MDTPARRSARARRAALILHASHDTKAHTAPARKAFLIDKWQRLVDPDGVLPADERQKRASRLLRAHMTELALKSAAARAAKKAAR